MLKVAFTRCRGAVNVNDRNLSEIVKRVKEIRAEYYDEYSALITRGFRLASLLKGKLQSKRRWPYSLRDQHNLPRRIGRSDLNLREGVGLRDYLLRASGLYGFGEEVALAVFAAETLQ